MADTDDVGLVFGDNFRECFADIMGFLPGEALEMARYREYLARAN